MIRPTRNALRGSADNEWGSDLTLVQILGQIQPEGFNEIDQKRYDRPRWTVPKSCTAPNAA